MKEEKPQKARCPAGKLIPRARARARNRNRSLLQAPSNPITSTSTDLLTQL